MQNISIPSNPHPGSGLCWEVLAAKKTKQNKKLTDEGTVVEVKQIINQT